VKNHGNSRNDSQQEKTEAGRTVGKIWEESTFDITEIRRFEHWGELQFNGAGFTTVVAA
jgi:hypothetical protein